MKSAQTEHLNTLVQKVTTFEDYAAMKARMDRGYRPTLNFKRRRGYIRLNTIRLIDALLEQGYSCFVDGQWRQP